MVWGSGVRHHAVPEGATREAAKSGEALSSGVEGLPDRTVQGLVSMDNRQDAAQYFSHLSGIFD